MKVKLIKRSADHKLVVELEDALQQNEDGAGALRRLEKEANWFLSQRQTRLRTPAPVKGSEPKAPSPIPQASPPAPPPLPTTSSNYVARKRPRPAALKDPVPVTRPLFRSESTETEQPRQRVLI